MAVFLGLALCRCHLLASRESIKDVRGGIDQAETLPMQEAALYHLNVAKRLIEAAEAQYEEADFKAAENFSEQARNQLKRAKELFQLHQPAKAAPSEDEF